MIRYLLYRLWLRQLIRPLAAIVVGVRVALKAVVVVVPADA